MSSKPSTSVLPPSEEARLKSRLSYFFRSERRSRAQVHAFAQGLLDLGQVVVIGGLIRDLYLAGNRDFESDIDFVVQPESLPQFERIMDQLGAVRNRFGGYGLQLEKWKVDVWPLERTWAAVNGHADLSNLQDLVKVTFFNWDAVLYSVGENKLVADRFYFDRLASRYLEINLEPNPNPLGNAVRAIRYAARWEALVGPKLANHIARQIRDCGWQSLVVAERASFRHTLLHKIDGDLVVQKLRDLDRNDRCTIALPIASQASRLCSKELVKKSGLIRIIRLRRFAFLPPLRSLRKLLQGFAKACSKNL